LKQSKQGLRNDTDQLEAVGVAPALREEAGGLARQLFGGNTKKCTDFTDRLLDIYARAQGKNFLIVHSPGGWGNTYIKRCLPWERSIVNGVGATLGKMGYSRLLVQHFRSGTGLWEWTRDMRAQSRFFKVKAEILAAELRFLSRHLDNLRVILVGISQGAAFNNAVMQHLKGLETVYSVELGIFFLQKSRRMIGERTLVIDSNGVIPDAMMEWNILSMFMAFCGAPFRWVKNRLKGTPIKFSHCVNAPGHEYSWKHPEVRRQIEGFLGLNFSPRDKVEVDVS
jgi:hypothetical protein